MSSFLTMGQNTFIFGIFLNNYAEYFVLARRCRREYKSRELKIKLERNVFLLFISSSLPIEKFHFDYMNVKFMFLIKKQKNKYKNL